MAWLILFLISIVLFLLLVDLKRLKVNVWCGLLAVFLQMVIDSKSIHLDKYQINNPVIQINGSSLFFILGPVLLMGILISQHLPKNRWHIIINPLVLSALYSMQELLLIKAKALVYFKWDFYTSLLINTFVMVCLCWFSMFVLNKGRYLY